MCYQQFIYEIDCGIMESKYLVVFGGHCLGLFVMVILVSVSSGYPLDMDGNNDKEPAYLVGVKYDEYPMIVPKKRAAMLIDRLMVALQKAIDEEEEERAREHQLRTKNMMLKPEEAVRSMDLQRRGHGSIPGQQKGRVYWRCYFNAVTCF